tara:strand:+ start:32138 stop:33058 length:921 start_codon:yes stop_codon:yes gene_type:complete
MIRNSRRNFIKKTGIGALGMSIIPNISLAKSKNIKQLTILHTNDTHSHIQPIKNGRNQGLGGMAQRSTIIKNIRNEGNQVLLLDAGDIFQGTPYFNFYGGELEFRLMSKMGYDASTLGNHDFDNGINGLSKQLKFSKFPFIISNYDFTETELNDRFLKYKVFNKSGIKVGVFGIGIELDSLVPKDLYGNTIYQDPILKANYYSKLLKEELKCDLVICLSHLGFDYREKKVSDKILASYSRNIDLIIGGHTHTFLNEPKLISNLDDKIVQIVQVGWAGINIGRIDYFFDQKFSIKMCETNTILVKNS